MEGSFPPPFTRRAARTASDACAAISTAAALTSLAAWLSAKAILRSARTGAALDVFVEFHGGFGAETFGVGLGRAHHVLGGAFSLGALDLDLGQQGFGLLAQALGLVELGLDLGAGVVEGLGHQGGNAHADQDDDEHHHGQEHPKFGVVRIGEEAHGLIVP